MSKLADKIRKSMRPSPQPLGFAPAAAREPEPTVLCIADLGSDAGRVAEAFAQGADVVIVSGEPKAKDDAGPVGVAAPDADRAKVAALREAGADFVVVELGATPAEALLEEKIGFVLRAPGDAEDTTLRLIGDLGLDALIVEAPGEPLTLEALLGLRRIAALTRLPLLAAASPEAGGSWLQAMRDSGVCGVIVDAGSVGKLGKLRETILGLPARGRKRDERGDGAIPTGVGVAGQSHGDDDDDDDD
jgi:hypothetical protein